MKTIKKLFFTILLVMLILCFSSCMNEKKSVSGFLMDAPYSIKTQSRASKNLLKAEEHLRNMDRCFNAYNESSELYFLNLNKKISFSDKTGYLFDIIGKTYPYLNESFDISIRNLTELWDFKSDNPRVPDDFEIAEALKKTGYENIELGKSEIFLKKGVSIELGAVAKGYAADKAFELLKDDGAVIDIGGTIVSSVKEDMKVGIRNPDGNGILCSFKLKYGDAVATSGSYERCFYKDNKKYHHILDPKTGKCVENNLLSVSVVTDSALKSDILSTTYFVEGFSKEKTYDDAAAVIFVTNDKKVYIRGNLDMSDLNQEYNVVR